MRSLAISTKTGYETGYESKALGFVTGYEQNAQEPCHADKHPMQERQAQGKNLQVWGNHFVAHTLSDGARWEQLLGRSHRQGQRRATVSVTVPNFSEFSGALASAQQGARYIEEATGLNQRLLRADWVK